MDSQNRVAEPPGARIAGPGRQRARKLCDRVLCDRVLGGDPRLRIRTTQWLITVAVYIGCGTVFGLAMGMGWVAPDASMLPWATFVGTMLAVLYVALRSGWSARFHDAALTAPQIVLGVTAACWGYVLGGPVRTAALFPLLLVLIFGTFSLGWRRILWLTVFAIVSLSFSIALRHGPSPGGDWSLDAPGMHVDLVNLGMLVVLLPATSLVAVRLSSLRRKLRSERRALTEALAEVQRLATRDELTGLPNRRHIQELLDRELARSARHEHRFSIALIDLDHFKRINDAHGHAAGDAVLRSFAMTAVGGLRGHDVLARWGGEEFLLLMPDTAGPQAEATVWRMLERVGHLPFMDAGSLSFSAGVCEYRRGETATQLLDRADVQMYEAKRAGRGTVQVG